MDILLNLIQPIPIFESFFELNFHTRGRHPQQEEGGVHPLQAQGKADLGQEEEEKENIVPVTFKQLLIRP